MRQLVRQPQGSNYCGHACVATICGLSLGEVLELFHRHQIPRGLTGARHVREALFLLGYRMGEVTRFGRLLPDDVTGLLPDPLDAGLWLCRVRWKEVENRSHWVVVEDGHLLDPAMPEVSGVGTDRLAAVWASVTDGGFVSSGYRVRESGPVRQQG